MKIPDLVNKINNVSGQLKEAEAVRGKSSLDLTQQLISETCALLRQILENQDVEFQASLDQVAKAISEVTPDNMAAFQLDSEWGRVTAALGDVACSIDLSDQSVILVLQALNASRPPAKPTVGDLKQGLGRCGQFVCRQADLFAGDIAGVKSAIQHERASLQRRRVGGALAAASLVGVAVVTAPILAPVTGAIVLAGLGAGFFEGIKAAVGDRNDPLDTVEITEREFIIGKRHLTRHRA